MRGMKSKKYYAYFLLGKINLPLRRQGICDSWEECKRIVSGREARYQSFKTKQEAEEWLRAGALYETRLEVKMEPGIYFDAGTGRGKGVEVSVTDENGKDLLQGILAKKFINKFGKHLVRGKATNNYGELLACKFALQISGRVGIKRVFGDSKLIIDFWSKGYFKKDKLSKKTVSLILEVVKLRRQFEKEGGGITRVSGNDNPADLGFHK